MKYLYLIILFLFASCSVFDNEQTIPLEYTGEWQWVESTGGFVGMRIDADSVDYTQTLKIFEQNKAKWYLDGELVQEYRAQKLSDDYDAEFILRSILNDDEYTPMNRQIMGLNNGKLVIMDECEDCFIHKFIR